MPDKFFHVKIKFIFRAIVLSRQSNVYNHSKHQIVPNHQSHGRVEKKKN